MCEPRGSWYSRVSPSSPVTKILRYCFCTSPYLTLPSISVMTAGSFGRRASNSSTTRGRPPVMSLVLAVSRGILASTSPAETACPSSTIRCAPEGSRYLRTTLPFASRTSMRGCFFSSGDSMMTSADMPVFSSTCSCTVWPSSTSLNVGLARRPRS